MTPFPIKVLWAVPSSFMLYGMVHMGLVPVRSGRIHSRPHKYGNILLAR